MVRCAAADGLLPANQGRVENEFLLRSDNGLVFTSRDYTKMVRSYGLRP
ncbi:hypothetical protein AB1M95_08505 [Sulfitobacter sp. LCG007]